MFPIGCGLNCTGNGSNCFLQHKAMEQQTVSVAKSGIVCSLNARTAVLASANPRDSSYDPKKSVIVVT